MDRIYCESKKTIMWTGYRCSEDEELANSLVCWNSEDEPDILGIKNYNYVWTGYRCSEDEDVSKII